MEAQSWVELILAGKGRIALDSLLAKLLSLGELREIALRHGLKPKGFRVQRATVGQISTLLSDSFGRVPELQPELGAILERAFAAAEDRTADASGTDDLASVVAKQRDRFVILEREMADLRSKVERESASARKARESRSEAIAKRDAAEHAKHELEIRVCELERVRDVQRLELEQRRATGSEKETPEAAELAQLSRAFEETRRSEAEARKRIAELMSRCRALEDANEELESFLPRGQRERRRQLSRQSEAAPEQVLPRFTDEFFRSLGDLEVDQERTVFAAIARLVLQGFDYPGLHAKSLKGLGGLWSIRAGEHLRIYLVRDGDTATFEAAGTREEQSTYLKKRRGH